MIAVIRIRGRVDASKKIKDTLNMLRLKEVNNCVVLPEEPTYLGMLEAAKDWIAYGKINQETFLEMIKKRGRLEGRGKLDEEALKKLGFKSFEDLAKAVFEGKVRLNKLDSFNPVFRLTPPSKGHKSIKEHYPEGSLGNWGEKIGELLNKMI